MTNIGMLTPKRLYMERSTSFLPNFIFNYFNFVGLSLLEINRRVIRSPFHEDDDDDKIDSNSSHTNHFTLSDDAISSTKKQAKAWSVRARRDVPNLLRGDR